MSFWDLFRTKPATEPEPINDAPALEPIQIFGASDTLSGWIVTGGQRVTDLLKDRPSLRVCTDPSTDTWREIEREDIFAVAPPQHTTKRKLHRQKHSLLAIVGPYQLRGLAHLPPGSPLDPFLLRTRQDFLPMTNVWIQREDDASFSQDLPVIIINVGNLHQLRRLEEI